MVMRDHGKRSHSLTRVVGRLLCICGMVVCSLADSYAESPAELPSSKQEVASALAGLREKYGNDAVKLESQLLAYALQGGSILTASVAIPGIEEHEGRRYLRVELDTGIVYDDERDPPEKQPLRIWTDVILPTFLQFQTLEVPAEGLALNISYRHCRPDRRSEVLRRAREGDLASDVLSMRVLSEHVASLAKGELAAEELLQRDAPQLNGRPAKIEVVAATHAARPTPRPLLPEVGSVGDQSVEKQ
jgi:hypothetical protein